MSKFMRELVSIGDEVTYTTRVLGGDVDNNEERDFTICVLSYGDNDDCLISDTPTIINSEWAGIRTSCNIEVQRLVATVEVEYSDGNTVIYSARDNTDMFSVKYDCANNNNVLSFTDPVTSDVLTVQLVILHH